MLTFIPINRSDGPDGFAKFKGRLERLAGKKTKRKLGISLSASTVRKYSRKLGLKSRKVDLTTLARRNACSDNRNFISFAVMVQVFTNNLAAEVIMNIDDTQVYFGAENSKRVLMFSRERYESWGVKQGRIRKVSNVPLTSFFVKIRVLTTLSGSLDDFCVFIAVDALERNEFKKLRVPGFAYGRTLHIYFVQKRGSIPDEANADWTKQVLLPFVEKQRNIYRLQGEKGVVFVDGEFANVLQSLDAIIKSKNIKFGKVTHSTRSQFFTCKIILQEIIKNNTFESPTDRTQAFVFHTPTTVF